VQRILYKKVLCCGQDAKIPVSDRKIASIILTAKRTGRMEAHVGCNGIRSALASCSYSHTASSRLIQSSLTSLTSLCLPKKKQQPHRLCIIVNAAQETTSEAAPKRQSKQDKPADIAGRPKADDFEYPMPVVNYIPIFHCPFVPCSLNHTYSINMLRRAHYCRSGSTSRQ